MGLLSSFATAFGFGAACVKSERDLQKKANSPDVRQGIAEYKYLYDKVPVMRGYNRVLEFDVIHARIREDLAEVKSEIEKYYLLIHTIHKFSDRWESLCMEEWNRRRRQPNSKEAYMSFVPLHCKGSFPDLEYADAIGWWDWLKATGEDVVYGLSENMQEYYWGYATRCAQSDLFERKYTSFKKADYDYRQYLLELGRKTAYDNGYLPSCQDITTHRAHGYSALYGGKIPCGWSRFIAWETGIPNQSARQELAEWDAQGTFRREGR